MSELRDDIARNVRAIYDEFAFREDIDWWDAAADAVLVLLRPQLIPEGMTAEALERMAADLHFYSSPKVRQSIAVELRVWADVLAAGYSKET